MRDIVIEILNNEIVLDQACWACSDGTVMKGWIRKDGTCERCGGTGYVLTDVGEAIVKLVQRHCRLQDGKERLTVKLIKNLLCTNCGWKGTDKDLVDGVFGDEIECPNCRADAEEYCEEI